MTPVLMRLPDGAVGADRKAVRPALATTDRAPEDWPSGSRSPLGWRDPGR
jgi:hypothetical protein